MANEDYWKEFHQIQSLILEVLYELDFKNFIPYLDKFPDTIAKKYKLKTKEEINKNLYEHAFKNLILQKLIEVDIVQDLRVESNKQKKRDYVRITVKGTTRVIQKRLAVLVDDAKQSIDKVEQKIEKRIETTRKYMDDVKKEVTIVKNDTERIEKDFKREQNRFYAKLIEIFGIFVAIFSFIIVGFNEISNNNDIAHIVIIFVLITCILIVLLLMIEWVVKSINKPDVEKNKPKKPKDVSIGKATINWSLFSFICIAGTFEFYLLAVIFRMPSHTFNIILQALFIVSVSLIISYSTWHDIFKKVLWNATNKSMFIITAIQIILIIILGYFAIQSVLTI